MLLFVVKRMVDVVEPDGNRIWIVKGHEARVPLGKGSDDDGGSG